MRNIKGISIILLVLTIMIGVCRCKMNITVNTNDAISQVVLNERQK